MKWARVGVGAAVGGRYKPLKPLKPPTKCINEVGESGNSGSKWTTTMDTNCENLAPPLNLNI